VSSKEIFTGFLTSAQSQIFHQLRKRRESFKKVKYPEYISMLSIINDSVNAAVKHYKKGDLNWPMIIFITLAHVAGSTYHLLVSVLNKSFQELLDYLLSHTAEHILCFWPSFFGL
jgi:hypothetical protein